MLSKYGPRTKKERRKRERISISEPLFPFFFLSFFFVVSVICFPFSFFFYSFFFSVVVFFFGGMYLRYSYRKSEGYRPLLSKWYCYRLMMIRGHSDCLFTLFLYSLLGFTLFSGFNSNGITKIQKKF